MASETVTAVVTLLALFISTVEKKPLKSTKLNVCMNE
jgi:hypothetical protein